MRVLLLLCSLSCCLSLSRPAAAEPFQDGATDRASFEQWYTQLTGYVRSGAEFWTGHRSMPGDQSCAGPGDASWTSGCEQAKAMLAPFDRRRLGEPAYRAGWNSYRAAQPADPASNPIGKPTTARAAASGAARAADAQRDCRIMLPGGQVYDPNRDPPWVVPPQLMADASECTRRKEAAAAEIQEQSRLAAEEQRRIRVAAQQMAENAEDNYCKVPRNAGGVMDDFNGSGQLHYGIRATDMLHITTTRIGNEDDFACEALFVLSNGVYIWGSMTYRKNAADRMIYTWKPLSSIFVSDSPGTLVKP